MKSHRNSTDSLEKRGTKGMTEPDSMLSGGHQDMLVR